MAETTGLHCQKCKTPLKIDPSLEDLNPASFKILADAAPALEPKALDAPRSAAARERKQQYDEATEYAGPPIHKRSVPPGQRAGGKLQPDMSYIMLTDSQVAGDDSKELTTSPNHKKALPKKLDVTDGEEGGEALSQQMETTMRLFEILSARSDIDHPVCSECTELLLDGLQKRQAGVIRERDAYVEFLRQAQEDVPTDEEKAKTKRDLEDAQQREKAALEELEALEAEKARMEDEIAALDAEAEALDEEEESFWRERNAFTQELTAFREERDSLQNQLVRDTKILEALQRTNVYNDTFCIGHDGNFGTINGLRLGRLADHPVDWPEINAALGQMVLLLVVLSEKLRYSMKGYKLIPLGSSSKIIEEDPRAAQTGASSGKASQGKVHELYSSGSMPFGLGLLQSGFDHALIAFLDCLRQLGQHVERTSKAKGVDFKPMPYKIVIETDKKGNKYDGRLGDLSIKLSSGDKEWTKACKWTLTCCKFLLAHASHEDQNRDAQ